MTTAPSFAAIGRRLHIVADQHHAADIRTSALAEHSAEHRACEDEMSLLLNEEIDLSDLVLSMRPETLEDAAVQLGVLFLHLSYLTDYETSKPDLKLGIRRAKRVAAGLTTVICRLAGVDPADAGDRQLATLLKRWGPDDAGDAG